MPKDAKFEDLFQRALEDLYDAEKQIVAALPKMIAASSSAQLSAALESHLEETRVQVSRLETIFEQIAEETNGRECRPMQALVGEGEKVVEEFAKSAVRDAAIIGAAQKVEHYEIAAYLTAAALAEVLGQQEAFDLLQESLQEEMEADETLTGLSEAILSGDDSAEEDEEEEEEEVDR